MKLLRKWVLSLVSVCTLASQTQAGFIFDIGDVVTTAGSTVVVPVTVTTPDGTQFGSNGGFNLGIDVQPAGNAIVSGLSFDTAPNQVSGSTYFANPSLNTGQNAIFNIDGIVNSGQANAGAPALVNNTPATVFNLRFNVAPGVAPGTVFALSFASNLLTSATDSTGVPLNLNAAGPGTGAEYALRAGSITISAVPEPSSIALMGLVMAGGAVVFARRKRKS
jgi:flagellar capping protein FliD